MRLGIVSDTHGHVAGAKRAVTLFDSLEIEIVLHCSDIGSPDVVALFGAWPAHFVFGNCDADRAALETAIARIGGQCHGEFGDLTLDGVRIALLHSHDQRRFRETIRSAQWDVICYGHTHVAATDRRDELLLLNPGAVYRANPHSVAILELPATEATIVEI